MTSQSISIGFNAIGASATVNKLKSFCEKNKLDDETSFQVCVVAAEAINNIIQHSPKSANDGFIKITFNLDKSGLDLCMVYWSPEFEPPAKATLPDKESLSGRGWPIIQEYMDKISYKHHFGMNTLTLHKQLSIQSAA